VTVAALDGLAKTEDVKADTVNDAISRYGIEPEVPNPAGPSPV
jgi:hypothetical protein